MDKQNSASNTNRQQPQVQGAQMQQQGKVNIPVETFIQLIQQCMKNGQQKFSFKHREKSPLVRAKSDPLHGKVYQNSKRKSVPEIFIFPDLKENSSSNSETPHVSSEPVSCDGQIANDNPDVSMSRSEIEAQEGNKLQDINSKMLPLSLSYEDRKATYPGVSEVYFKNVVNELIKTKKYVKDLQDQCKLLIHDRVENDKLKRELQSLRFTAQQLKREHKKLTDQNKKLKIKLQAYQPVGANESFELETSDGVKINERATQTDSKMVGLQTDDKNMQETINELKKDNIVLNQLYSDLKDNVRILNSCLAEEKQKNREKDIVLMDKEEERRTLYSQLSQRRQEYDEMRLEYNALKKELNLYEDDPHHSHRSRHSSRSSGTKTQYSSQTSSRIPSSENILLNVSPRSQSGPKHDSQSSGHRLQNHNDLSSMEDETHAPSNVPLPFSRDYSDYPNVSATNEAPVAYGKNETQPHAELSCPYCYQTFQEDGTYLKHLQKCYSFFNC